MGRVPEDSHPRQPGNHLFEELQLLLETGEKVLVSLEVRDEQFNPTTAEDYTVFLRPADGESQRRTLRSKSGDPGVFEGSFTMEEPGAFSILVHKNNNPEDEVLARQDILVRIPEREMARSSQDRDTLEEIARATDDGRYLFLARADELLQEFSGRKPFPNEVDRTSKITCP